jgi:hypothetical protein
MAQQAIQAQQVLRELMAQPATQAQRAYKVLRAQQAQLVSLAVLPVPSNTMMEEAVLRVARDFYTMSQEMYCR